MASAVVSPYTEALGSTKRRKDPGYAAFPSTSKRLKVASTLGTPGATFSSLPPVNQIQDRRAEQWFDDKSKTVSRRAPFSHNKSPLCTERQPSSDGNSVCAIHSDGSYIKQPTFGKPTAPTRSLLAQMESSESNSEDYRSVIDDLTIENKKLKKKLRQYERLHCSHLQEDKLFEIRVHGLASHWKRELEDTLRGFASSIDMSQDSPASKFVPTGRATSNSTSLENLHGIGSVGFPSTLPSAGSMPPSRKPSSVSTSGSKPIDSAYASMSGPAGNSYLQQEDKGRLTRFAQVSQKSRNVASYLHDIPETLVPQHTMVMSEHEKSKLVVKRLEQIFTGKGAAPRDQTQSHQQQEVSRSAARADQSRLKARGRGGGAFREGVREARLLPDDANLQVDSFSEAEATAQQNGQSIRGGRDPTQGELKSRNQSPDQRPTRPLDLDLHRAQVPADNIDYIRHLGLSPVSASGQATVDDGWVYLNLLTSMAQLHTLNVTPDFIRHAVADVSSKFELSPDGTKVRWRGDIEGSRQRSDNEGNLDVNKQKSTTFSPSEANGVPLRPLADAATSQDRQEPNTALPSSTYDPLVDSGPATKRRPVFLEKETPEADFQYKPLFFHGPPSNNDDENDDDSESALSSDQVENATGLNSGINSGSHGLRETEVNMRKQNTENGPIIFYHKARFCTDLSGDPHGTVFDESAYNRYTQDPIGCSSTTFLGSDESNDESASDSMELDPDNAQRARSTLNLDELKSCISSCVNSTSLADLEPIPMEMSGLGGVQPTDNFMVSVQVQHRNEREENRNRPNFLRRSSNLPSRKMLPRSQPVEAPITSRITATAKQNLDPSSLPPPSYLCLPFSSSGSESGIDDEGKDRIFEGGLPVMSYDHTSQSYSQPVHGFTPRPAQNSFGSSSDETKESSYAASSSGEDDDDDSIDLLAHARSLDPELVAAQERDFEDSIALNESISAAAGGNSIGPARTAYIDDSDVDSMSVDGDGRSRMEDSD